MYVCMMVSCPKRMQHIYAYYTAHTCAHKKCPSVAHTYIYTYVVACDGTIIVVMLAGYVMNTTCAGKQKNTTTR